MKVFAKTDIGKARQTNQDFYYISSPEEVIQLYILADGMGGYKGGDIASCLAVDSVKKYIESNYATTEKEKESLQTLIKNAIEYANMVVYEKSKVSQELEGMGTTIEVCLIYNNRAYIGHIGDSRIYRLRKEFLKRVTVDHSYVEKLIKDGTITREESYTHPKKNMLTKALGCTSYVEPDVMVKGFQKEDILVLCSDGLTNLITEEQLETIIRQNLEKAAENLIEKANELGGYDNITVIIIQND